jgi:hypothetical protein
MGGIKMKIVKMSKTALLCVSLLGLSIQCLANEIPASMSTQQVVREAEAVVINVDQGNVTLQDLGDKNNKIVASFSNADKFKAGDKVILVGDTLIKVSSNTQAAATDYNL